MTGLIDTATSILLSSERRVEVTANNIANSSTSGFKRSATFLEVLQSDKINSSDSPVFGTTTDLSQGRLTLTGEPLDFAIYGPGFLQLRDGDQLVYARGGSFRLADGGRFTDAAGRALQSLNGGDLVTSGGEIEVMDDGTVLEDNIPVGMLALWEAAEIASVQPMGGSLFKIDEAELAEPAESQVRQGFLEASNVMMSDEMVAMMAAVRQAEGGGRIVQVYDQLMGQAVQTFSRGAR